MRLLLGIILVVWLALAVSSRRWWGLRRTRVGAALTTGGWVSVLVGFLIGPWGAGLVHPDQILTLRPLVFFLLGWVGMMIGLQLHRSLPSVVPAKVLSLASFDLLISGLAAGAAGYVLLRLGGLEGLDALAPAGLLGVCAVGWPAEVRSLRIGRPDLQAVTAAARASAGLGAIGAVVVYGVLVKAVQIGGGGVQVAAIPQIGLVLLSSLLAGVVMGIIGLWLVALAGRAENEFLVALLGLVSFTAGSAIVLGTSPLFTTVISGAVIVNSPRRELARFRHFIIEAEQPIAMALMLLAGVLLDPQIGRLGLGLAAGIFAVRLIVKQGIGAKLLAAAVTPQPNQTVASGLVRQSPLAIPLALGYALSATGSVGPLDGPRLLCVAVLVGLAAEMWPLLATAGNPLRRRAGGAA